MLQLQQCYANISLKRMQVKRGKKVEKEDNNNFNGNNFVNEYIDTYSISN